MIVIIDIYDLIWDEKSFEPTDAKHLYGGAFETNNIEDFEKGLRTILMTTYQVFNLNIDYMGNISYVKISLFNDSYIDHTNIEELEKYFSDKLIKTSSTNVNNSHSYSSNHLVHVVLGEEEEIKEIEGILQEQGVSYKVINKKKNQLEKGFSDIMVQVLIAIGVEVGKGVFNQVTNKIKEKYPDTKMKKTHIGSFDHNQLLENVADVSGESVVSLSIREFYTQDNNTYSVRIYSRDWVYTVICDENSKILGFEKNKIGLTR